MKGTMRTFSLATAATGIAAAVIALTGPGTAAAATSATATGGPEKIAVSVQKDESNWSGTVLVDGNLQPAILTPDKPSAELTGITPGNHQVAIYLYIGEGPDNTVNTPAVEVLNEQVEVTAATDAGSGSGAPREE